MKLSIIIPAYNESEGIAHIAEKLPATIKHLQETYDVEVLFVDDGSTDNTGELLKEEFASEDYVCVVAHKTNRGLGAAVRTGFKHAQGDIVVTTDFDGTYDFATIPAMLTYLEDAYVDIVTASPYHPQGRVDGVPKYRLLFSFGASLLYRILVHPKIYTWTALFRAYRRTVINNVEFDNNGFLCNTEILVKAIKQNYTVKEFPTVLHTRQFGQSSIRIFQVTMSHLQYQWQLLKTSKTARLLGIITLMFVVLMVRKRITKR